jgi:hypothetical protein
VTTRLAERSSHLELLLPYFTVSSLFTWRTDGTHQRNHLENVGDGLETIIGTKMGNDRRVKCLHLATRELWISSRMGVSIACVEASTFRTRSWLQT